MSVGGVSPKFQPDNFTFVKTLQNKYFKSI